MNSKLPPKYTILFLLLFISISNKGETALTGAELYPAETATAGEAFYISTPHSTIVSDDRYTGSSALESYQWYTDIVRYI